MSRYTPINLAFKVYEPAVKSEASDLILIHGITANKESWEEIAKDLADKSKRRVFTLDMRNHGDSGWSGDFDWKIMAKDVIHFMDQQCISSATFIGHSMGGIISMIIALTKPEKINGFIVEDITPILDTSEFKDLAKEMVDLINLYEREFKSLPSDLDLLSAMTQVAVEVENKMPKVFQAPPEHQGKFISKVDTLFVKKDGRFKWKMNAEEIKNAFSKPETYKDLEGRYEKHAYFVYGTLSPFKIPDVKDRILKLFPKAQFRGVEGATHLVHNQCPEEFLEIALKFLGN